ncbi:phosphate ABC transporter substrate-binding protein PstS [Streptomyces natalensis]|uniref:Phosphate-binding protein n=1 Tax=Streptomyces natalensis ATCC 27448 TaxID=1240678 RepID=A0A0D7CMJ6_9ACTN|nr:phosphate ABC transporter substrate-binding protein PstS [Streptomyces natalensis]KIZ17408.1 phosphate-binding protein [Streptomyces natalensis ATCC 27448]
MKLRRKGGPRSTAAGTAVLCGALVLAGCSGSSSEPSGSAPVSTAAGGIACGKAATLNASGSTAQQYAMKYWIKNYTQACHDTKINYDGNGSGAGQKDFLHGKTAFAGSDSPLSADQVNQSKKVCTGGGHAVHLPVVAGPIAVAFHLPGVDRLILDAPTLAKIFNGQLTKWNDPAIAQLNKGAKLPATPIKTFHRADSSGTTDNFTAYLAATAHGAWPYAHSKEWPAKGGQAVTGSSDLATQVQRTEGAIGYVDLPYAVARMLRTVSVDTGATAPADANVIASSHAIAGAKTVDTGNDVLLKLDYATKAPGAYPINAVTYEIVCNKGNKPATWPATKAFLTYVASPKGQQNLTFQGYATLPASVVNKVRSEIGMLS